MEFSSTACKICNKEHLVFAENTDNLWRKLCMLCRHEIRRTNQFLAQLEKSSAFLLSTAHIIESVVKAEPEDEMGGKNVRLWIDSDKVILGAEPPGAALCTKDSYTFCRQHFTRVDIKIENTNEVNLESKLPGASQFIENNYNFSKKNSPPMEIEYVGVEEDVSNLDSCSSENVFTAHHFKSDDIQEEIDCKEELPCTTQENFKEAVKGNFLSTRSLALYEKRYDNFKKWCTAKKVNNYSETILLDYFSEQSKVYKPTSLWSIFSMLKCTIGTKHDVNIGEYRNLLGFLKKQCYGYKPKSSNILREEQIFTFLKDAPDETYLMIKVALIFGIFGACRRHELYNLQAENIIDIGHKLIVTISVAKTYNTRTFTIQNNKDVGIDYLNLYRKYAALRSDKSAGNQRFFLKYTNNHCNNQVVGINTFGRMPCIVAKYLNLSDPQLFTGHCFKRLSTTLPSFRR